MKKILILLLCVLLLGCSPKESEKMKLMALPEKTFLVVSQTHGMKEGDPVRISLEKEVKVGDIIEVERVGAIRESFPVQFDVENVVPVEKFPVRITLEQAVKLKELLQDKVVLLDVRTKEEYDEGHIPTAQLSPVESLSRDVKNLDKDTLYIIYCRSGHRSSIAREMLDEVGFQAIDAGGIMGYKGEIEK
ncbi:rhodanese-like domain-containing protein [Guggenheimella bovis]